MIKGWELNPDIPLETVFEWCLLERQVDRLLLAAQFDTRYKKKKVLTKPEIEEVVTSLFADKVIERKLVRRWPGTELCESLALIFYIKFDLISIQSMSRLGPLLSNWRHSNNPPLPEDPCLFRQGDEWPVLVSVTHERDAWILSEERPPFCKGGAFDFKPENLLVPPAEGGFVGM